MRWTETRRHNPIQEGIPEEGNEVEYAVPKAGAEFLSSCLGCLGELLVLPNKQPVRSAGLAAIAICVFTCATTALHPAAAANTRFAGHAIVCSSTGAWPHGHGLPFSTRLQTNWFNPPRHPIRHRASAPKRYAVRGLSMLTQTEKVGLTHRLNRACNMQAWLTGPLAWWAVPKQVYPLPDNCALTQPILRTHAQT